MQPTVRAAQYSLALLNHLGWERRAARCQPRSDCLPLSFLRLILLVSLLMRDNAGMTKLTKEQRRVIRSAALVAKKLKLSVDGVGVCPTGLAGSFVPYTILSK